MPFHGVINDIWEKIKAHNDQINQTFKVCNQIVAVKLKYNKKFKWILKNKGKKYKISKPKRKGYRWRKHLTKQQSARPSKEDGERETKK